MKTEKILIAIHFSIFIIHNIVKVVEISALYLTAIKFVEYGNNGLNLL